MSSVSAPITTRPHATHFTADFVQPPTEYYLDRDDILLILSWGSARSQDITLKGRILTPAGEVQRVHINHSPNDDRSPNYTYHALTEGCLLGLSVTQRLNPIEHGDVYVEVSILRGGLATFERTHVLISDYVSAAYSPSWPGGRLMPPSESRSGRLYVLTGTDPPANTAVSETVPTNARWRLRVLQVILNTSAVAGNRRVYLQLNALGGSPPYFRKWCPSVQAAGLAVQYNFCHWGTIPTGLLSDEYMDIPPDLVLQEGHEIYIWMNNPQAGDNFQAPKLYVEEWFQ